LAQNLENELLIPHELWVQSSADQRSVLMADPVKLGKLERKMLLETMILFQRVAEENWRIHLIQHARTDDDFSQLAVSGNVVASCFGIGVKT